MKYLLQPVIENSIKHGFKDKKMGGQIRLQVIHQSGKIIFEVYDNGNGIDEVRLKEIRDDMKQALRNSGVGIANTDARIKLKYGPQYGITLESSTGHYTRVSIMIPETEKR